MQELPSRAVGRRDPRSNARTTRTATACTARARAAARAIPPIFALILGTSAAGSTSGAALDGASAEPSRDRASFAARPGSAEGRPGAPLALVGVDVVPMDRERVLRDQVVLVRDGRIAAMGAEGDVAIPEEALTVDASGKYLVPGLADMHVHVRGSPSDVEQVLALWVAAGVTTVLNLDGRPEHLTLRRRIESDELLGPRLFTSGPSLRGPPGSYEEGREAVRRQEERGYGFIKVYSFLPAAAYRGVIAEAGARQMPVVGHAVRAAGGIEAALASGQHVVHMEEFVYGHFRKDVRRDFFPDEPDGASRALGELLDESAIDGLAEDVAASGIYVTPNLVAYHMILQQVRDLESLLARPEVRYVPESILDDWRPENNGYTNRSNLPRFEAILATTFPFLQKLTAAFQRAGVPLLAGTDASIPVLVPGFSTHDDLQELVAAGLTPYEALSAATRIPARFLQTDTRSGTVEVGKNADLVLLEDDPLDDVANTRAIAGVVIRGRWLDRSDLDALLQRGAR